MACRTQPSRQLRPFQRLPPANDDSNVTHPGEHSPSGSFNQATWGRKAGQLTWQIAARLVDRVVTVDEEQIAQAILHLAETEHAIVEGAGAVGLAALLSGQLPELQSKRVALILSGGNIDLLTLSRLIVSSAGALEPNLTLSVCKRDSRPAD